MSASAAAVKGVEEVEPMPRAPARAARSFGRNGGEVVETAESAAIKEHGRMMHDVATALSRIAKAIENNNDMKERQADAWRSLIRKYGPWALASVPVIGAAVGGIAPNIAEAIGNVVASAPR